MYEKLKTLSLMAATFFCPLGYDVAFKMLLDATGSYWLTTAAFYGLSASFAGLFLLFVLCARKRNHDQLV